MASLKWMCPIYCRLLVSYCTLLRRMSHVIYMTWYHLKKNFPHITVCLYILVLFLGYCPTCYSVFVLNDTNLRSMSHISHSVAVTWKILRLMPHIQYHVCVTCYIVKENVRYTTISWCDKAHNYNKWANTNVTQLLQIIFMAVKVSLIQSLHS